MNGGYNSRWQKGQSGNPKGKTRRVRGLTQILRAEASEMMTVNEHGGVAQYKDVLARLIWQYVTQGEVVLKGRILRVETVSEWLSAVKWIYAQIDGMARGDEAEDTTRTFEPDAAAVNPPTRAPKVHKVLGRHTPLPDDIAPGDLVERIPTEEEWDETRREHGWSDKQIEALKAGRDPFAL